MVLVVPVLLSGCGYTIRPMAPSEMAKAADPMPLKAGVMVGKHDKLTATSDATYLTTGKHAALFESVEDSAEELGPKFVESLRGSNVFDGVQFPIGPLERLDLILNLDSQVSFTPDPHERGKVLSAIILGPISWIFIQPFLSLNSVFSAAAKMTVRDRTGRIVKVYSEQQEVHQDSKYMTAVTSPDGYVAAYNSAVENVSLKLINDLIRDKALLRSAAANATAAAGGIKRKDLNAAIKQAMAQKKPEEVEIRSDVDRPDYRAAENVNNFALVIGIDKYSNLPEAQFADRDARAMRKHLEALGYPARNIKTLLNDKATKTAMTTALDAWLGHAVNAESTVFFYYSGHGAPNPATGQAYMVPWDGDPQFLDDTAYPLKGLYAKLNSLGAKKIIVALDSCFSGIGGRSVLAKGVRPLVNKVETGAMGEETISFAASGGDQISGTIEEQGHGAFTYYFLKGLNGDAKNAAGQVTVQSLYDYLLPKVEDAAGRQSRSQTPLLWSASPQQRAETILR